MIKKQEDEIIKKWPHSWDKPTVSIQCLVYNHEKYLERCLDGFLEQDTNFPFEVVIHDDASTDNSAEIIRQYEARFPKIIHPIYEKENLYSKKDGSLGRTVRSQLRGEYIALCEGDDYWCSKKKLQKQVDFLDSNPSYSACTHLTKTIDLAKSREYIYGRFPQENVILKLSDFLCKMPCHTSSILCRRDFFINRPEWCYPKGGYGGGDYPLTIYLSLNGPIIRFGEIMSVYRKGVPGSWTKRIATNVCTRMKVYESNVRTLQMAKKWSEEHGLRNDDDFNQALVYHNYVLKLLLGDFKAAKSDMYSQYWKSETFIQHIKHYLRYYIKIKLGSVRCCRGKV